MDIQNFIKKEFPKEEKVIYIAFGIWFMFLIFSFIFSSGFEAKYEWLGKINPGTWGDSFGIINSLISVITFFLVYKTFGLQQEMLKNQKEELESTREELKGQKEIMNEGKFHEYFMFLMKHKDFIKDTITVESTALDADIKERITHKGEESFYYWFREIKGSHGQNRKEVLEHITQWHDTHNSKINEYLEFIKKMEMEINKENNSKYNLFNENMQSFNEKFVISYLRENNILTKN